MNPLFGGVSRKLNVKNFHQEIPYDDYKKELLLPHKLSQLGPALATGDVNNDGQMDFYVGGSASFSGKLYVSQGASFIENKNPIWEAEKRYEDIAAEFFDADNDGDVDLYVASGSNQFEIGDEKYQDRLYLNNGKGEFTKSANKLPQILTSTGTCLLYTSDAADE